MGVVLTLAATLAAGCGSSHRADVRQAAASTTSSSAETTSTTAAAPTSTVPPTSAAPPTSAVPHATWRRIPAAPGSAAGAPVWTGDEFVVWGGQDDTFLADGVAYRPATNKWRRLAPSPLSARRSHTGVWTGKYILYWGGLNGSSKALADGAAYDPANDTWRRLPAAPIAGHFDHEAVWTGREMVLWGGTDSCCPADSTIHDVEAVAYDPAADRWRRLADVPPPWSGDDGPAITGSHAGDVFVWRNGKLGRLEMSANRWTDLGSPPPSPPPASGVQCLSTAGPVTVGAYSADHLFVWSGGCKAEDGAAFDLQKSAWATIGAAPSGLWKVVVTPDVFGVTTDPGPGLARYDQQHQTWQALAAPPAHSFGALPVARLSGADILVWGGHDGSSPVRTGALYHP